MMNIPGDDRMGFFDRYNKIVYDSGLPAGEQTITSQASQTAKIMIMGDSIAQNLAGGEGQRIIQNIISSSGQDYTFIGHEWSFGGGVGNEAFKSVKTIDYWKKIQNGEIVFDAQNTPTMAIVQLGTNDLASGYVSSQSDIAEKFISPYESIIQSLRSANPSITILIAPVPESNQSWNSLVSNVNTALIEMADRLNTPDSKIIVLNDGAPLYTKHTVSNDNVHPNAIGINNMSEIIGNTIRDELIEQSQQTSTLVTPKKVSYQKSALLGSGPVQIFENLAQKYVYPLFPGSETEGLLPIMWKGAANWVRNLGNSIRTRAGNFPY
jgi:hypothetical protein